MLTVLTQSLAALEVLILFCFLVGGVFVVGGVAAFAVVLAERFLFDFFGLAGELLVLFEISLVLVEEHFFFFDWGKADVLLE